MERLVSERETRRISANRGDGVYEEGGTEIATRLLGCEKVYAKTEMLWEFKRSYGPHAKVVGVEFATP